MHRSLAALLLCSLALASCSDKSSQSATKPSQTSSSAAASEYSDAQYYADIAKSMSFIEAKDFSAAEKVLERVVSARPSDPFALNNLACARIAYGNYKTALPLLERAAPLSALVKAQNLWYTYATATGSTVTESRVIQLTFLVPKSAIIEKNSKVYDASSSLLIPAGRGGYLAYPRRDELPELLIEMQPHVQENLAALSRSKLAQN